MFAGLLAALIGAAGTADAAALTNGETIQLWPGKAPGSEQVSFHNTVTERSKVAGKHDRILTKIDTPTLTAYLPEKPNGTAVIAAPGGGYGRIVLDKESGEFAKWLNPLGVTVFVLHYRLPCDSHEQAKDVPLEDGQRAVRLVRAHAAEWKLDPARIGLLAARRLGIWQLRSMRKLQRRLMNRLMQWTRLVLVRISPFSVTRSLPWSRHGPVRAQRRICWGRIHRQLIGQHILLISR